MNPLAPTNSYQIQNKEMSQRFQFVQLKGKEILVVDFSHADRKTGIELSAEFDNYAKGLEPKGQLRVLFDIEALGYDPSGSNDWKAISARYDKHFHSTALVHVSPLFRLIIGGLRAYLKLIGQPMSEKRGRLFADKAAALEFLSRD